MFETRNGSSQTTFQYVWGTQYVDELVMIDKNGDPSESNDCDPDDQSGESTADARYFVHQDRNWNVVALTDYDPSGSDEGNVVERYHYTPYGQFIVLNGDSGNGEMGNVLPTSTVGNAFAHQGLPFDQDKGSCQNRYREHVASLQRFGQRDPWVRPSVTTAYLAYSANPAVRVDPAGLVPQVGQPEITGLWDTCELYLAACGDSEYELGFTQYVPEYEFSQVGTPTVTDERDEDCPGDCERHTVCVTMALAWVGTIEWGYDLVVPCAEPGDPLYEAESLAAEQVMAIIMSHELEHVNIFLEHYQDDQEMQCATHCEKDTAESWARGRAKGELAARAVHTVGNAWRAQNADHKPHTDEDNAAIREILEGVYGPCDWIG